ncbi:MAG: hypothetical protein GY832_32205 [Chloroflexi bacterium]|nr:hypothetical protein [Chloroflexota bacterium]
MNQQTRVETLLTCLGIDTDSFAHFLEWALSEQLVRALGSDIPDSSLFDHPDSLRQFRDHLRLRTGRTWSVHDLNLLYDVVKKQFREHYREPITYGEYLKLLWTAPHCCTKCDRVPPEVVLHIDHIIPVSLGGKSKRYNLQFLCATCNLKKSNKLEGEKPWLDLK